MLTCSTSSPYFVLLFVWLCLVVVVNANTEVFNFRAEPGPDVALPFTSRWLSLDPIAPERSIQVHAAPIKADIQHVCDYQEFDRCPHDVWISLDLDHAEWTPFSAFTLRISWPASSPADFLIDLFTPTTLLSFARNNSFSGNLEHESQSSIASETRRRYARIRVTDAAVLTPTAQGRKFGPVSFVLLVEPLYLGVIPRSVVPTLLSICATATVCFVFVAPYIYRYLLQIASVAKDETLLRIRKDD
ncbi:hypothetical protein K474DRAFT_1586354 [Panus rudis PR-1116 ss-1]|nr:hypothetical protein K474DRAFT_1586354 [Panus rudis PR-1116 ss-1]